MNLTRRRFLQSSLATSALPAVGHAVASNPFSFILLGDLHYDKLEHHDFKWLDAHHPGDLSQIKNYSKLTAEVMPTIFAAVRRMVEQTGAKFVLQVGDLVEGLCGSVDLAARQNREALEFVTQANLGVPFLFTKGNHDVTGDGAVEAFDAVLQPFMSAQARRIDAGAANAKANHTLAHAGSQFVFFDAYAKDSLDWFEAVAAKRATDYLFVTIHPPVVPYGARSTWHIFSDEKSATKRAKLLDILGANEAVVLSGHLHKFSAITRQVAGKRFTQLAVSSVVSAPDEKPRDVLHGLDSYTGDQVSLEPRHSPDTIERRRAVYDAERKHVSSFEYANAAGFAVVTVRGRRIEAAIHVGSGAEPFRRVTLAA